LLRIKAVRLPPKVAHISFFEARVTNLPFAVAACDEFTLLVLRSIAFSEASAKEKAKAGVSSIEHRESRIEHPKRLFYWISIEKMAKMWYNTPRIGGNNARRQQK
jgi:hypothetical protein